MYDNVDLFDLERFVKAQDTYDSYNIALKEIKGRLETVSLDVVCIPHKSMGWDIAARLRSLASSPCLKPWRILDMIRWANACMKS